MEYAIEMLNITKDFPGIRANDDVTIQVKRGCVHALLGENGAGKSTLMSILFGLYQPTSGIIKIDGKPVSINNPNDSNKLGIGMVHQHFKLIDCFTVAENIVLGNEITNNYGFLDTETAKEKVRELSKLYGLEVDPDAKISDISVGMQQRVEILKMLYRNANILIFDEPTAVLTPQEIDELISIIKNLSAQGKTIILITHKLKEIKKVAETCSILRRGKCVSTISVKDATEKQMAELMVGREINFKVNKNHQEPGKTVLKIENLTMVSNNKVKQVDNLSIEVKAGEIFGIAGIDGNGQSELVYGITGLSPISEGKIFINDIDVTKMNIKERINKGIGHIPEDRHKYGLILDFSISENFIVHDFYEVHSVRGVLNINSITENATRLLKEFDVRSSKGVETITRTMSGGNQQKAIIAREIDRSPDLLIVVQPTRGLDVGAIEYIHERIVKERNKGKAILLVSFELDEILALSDRIGVMYNGHISKIVNAKETDENKLGLLMAGSEDV